MSQFLNRDFEESKKMHPKVYKNALNKKKDAMLLANNQSFDTATSCLILSSEEAVKAMMIFLHSEGFHIYKLQNSKKIFFDHKTRHNISKLIEAAFGLGESFTKFENTERSNKFYSDDETINVITNIVIDFKEAGQPFKEALERADFFEQFNDNKNRGFYSDYTNQLLVPSENITEETYNKTLEIVERIFRIYRILNVHFSVQATNHPQILKNSIDKKVLITIFNSGVVLLEMFKNGDFKSELSKIL